ncbi:unnamed protein product [Spirodela intermedia]|uniref:Uncharacterized protein n=1 Tax=Spirodela intermedia TaxID=51605 RepID=A0A7I8J3P3_SPIIN|nr:unnamed protein product [Spirodela intermedia]CAA6664837.1 unnamed protein product [Spirodela intermedia]
MEGASRGVQMRKGGLRTMPFIFANEIAEKLAVVGFSANMISYLTQELHMPLVKAATTLTNFGGTASLTPLLGAFLADAYLGRFWTITGASVIYQLVHRPSIHPSTPPVRRERTLQGSLRRAAGRPVCVLLLNSLGAGGIRPCVVAFGADQFDEADRKQKTRTWNFFNWYYFCMGLSILVAVTAVVYVQDNVSWAWGLAIPTFAMAASLVSFVAGFPLYRHLDPAGSPFTRLLQVAVAAARKRRLPPVTGSTPLYDNSELDGPISLDGKLIHTGNLTFLDKAAVVAEGEEEEKPNLWRLSTVHRVEELKSLMRMGPIWAAGILLITAAAQQGTFSLQQARTMNRRLSSSSSFQIPPGSMAVFTILSMLTTIVVYDRALIPAARRATGLRRGISYLTRMGVGFAISVLATLVAGFVEVKRRDVAATHGLLDQPRATVPISVFWLVPQYALHGMAEAFSAIGHLEFFYDQAPESMRSTATALFWLAIAAAHWLPDNLNRGRLENLYWIITFLQLLNLAYYAACAHYYTFKPLQQRQAGDPPEDSVELHTKV